MLKQFLSYNAVGIANTFLGFSIIYGLMFLGISPVESNAIGYGIGAVLSYFLNKKYTFKVAKHDTMQVVKFFMVLGVSYLFNFIALYILLDVLNAYIAQVVSTLVYTLCAFILLKYFVFTTVSK